MIFNKKGTGWFCFCAYLYAKREDRRRLGNAKPKKQVFLFVTALAFHYLCPINY